MKNDGVKVTGSGSGFKSCTSAPLEKWTRKKRSVYLTVFKLQSTNTLVDVPNIKTTTAKF